MFGLTALNSNPLNECFKAAGGRQQDLWATAGPFRLGYAVYNTAVQSTVPGQAGAEGKVEGADVGQQE